MHGAFAAEGFTETPWAKRCQNNSMKKHTLHRKLCYFLCSATQIFIKLTYLQSPGVKSPHHMFYIIWRITAQISSQRPLPYNASIYKVSVIQRHYTHLKTAIIIGMYEDSVLVWRPLLAKDKQWRPFH